MASGTGIGEFFVSLTVDSAQGAVSVSNLVQSFGELEISTLAEIGLLWELGLQLARITDAGIKASLGFAQFTMHTDLSAQVLQKWQIVAQQSHASAEDVTSSMENVTKGLRMMALGEDTPLRKAIQFLGMSAYDASGKLKDADQIMTDIRHRLGVVTQDAGMQEIILGWAGINANLRETLLLTDSVFSNRRSLAHGMTADQEKSFDAMYTRLQQIELVAKDIANDIASWASPAVMRFLDTELKALESIRWFWENSKTNSGDLRGSRTKEVAFENSPIGRLLGPGGEPGAAHQEVADFFARLSGNSPTPLPPEPAGGFRTPVSTVVHVDKHDTYNIHDAHDPEKVKGVIEQHWDDILGRKTIDGFDRQNNNGGY